MDHDLDLAGLRARVAGPVLAPGDPGYAGECRTFNLLTPLAPALVVAATSTEDVRAAVRFAAANGLAVAVRGGGHWQPHRGERALLITLDRMSGVTVDAGRAVARVTGGALWQQVLDATAPHGLAPLAGSAPHVGVIGYTLGGGHGPVLSRMHGYASDHVTAFELVTADGEVHIVDEHREPELFRAVRGSKGALGVVTAIQIGLFAVRTIVGGGLWFAGEDVAKVLPVWRDWAAELPEQATTSVAVLRLPPLAELPELLRGAFMVHVRYAYVGPAAEAHALLEPMRTAGPVVLDTVAEIACSRSGVIHADPPVPLPYVDAGLGLRALDDDTLQALVEIAGPDADCPLVTVELRALGGAMDREPRVSDVVPSRGLPFQLFALGIGGPEDAPRLREYLARTVRTLAPWAHGSSMPNFISPDDALDPVLVSSVYGARLHRLIAETKRRYDPANMFRTNLSLFT